LTGQSTQKEKGHEDIIKKDAQTKSWAPSKQIDLIVISHGVQIFIRGICLIVGVVILELSESPVFVFSTLLFC
jgi:hypothetical protein